MTYLALFHSALCLPALITALCPHFSLLLPLTIMVLPPLPTQSHLIDSDPVSLLSLFLVRLSHSIHGFMSSFLCDRTTLSTSPHPHQIPFTLSCSNESHSCHHHPFNSYQSSNQICRQNPRLQTYLLIVLAIYRRTSNQVLRSCINCLMQLSNQGLPLSLHCLFI